MKNNASIIYSFFLVIGDFLAILAAFVTAYILRVTLDPRPLVAQVAARDYFRVFLLLVPFWILIFALLSLYNKNTYEKRVSEFGRILVGTFVGILFVISYDFASDDIIFPARLVPIYALVLAFAFLILFRIIARIVRRTMFSFGAGVNNVLIIGDTPITQEMISMLSPAKVTGYRVIGVVGGKKHSVLGVAQNWVFETFPEAISALKHETLHSFIQTELYTSADKNNEILTYAQENHVAYRFVPGNSELFVGRIEVDLFRSIPVIAVHQTALIGWGRIVKRLFDTVVSFFALIFFAPLLLLIAGLIKIFDRGPVFFVQERLTRFNTTVNIYKFRTMKVAYSGMLPEEGFAKMGKPELAKLYRRNGDYLEHDPRNSRIGNFLRSLSLDELPQLYNVLRGDISLVGPRALVARDIDKSDKKNLILSVKSGLTGLAVVSGRKDLPVEERRKLDLYYVQNWSFWGDLMILTKTVWLVLTRKGAK